MRGVASEEPSAAAAFAAIEGVVRLGDEPRARPAVHRYRLPPNHPVSSPPPSNAVVYLEGPFSAEQMLPVPEEPVVLRQHGLQFFPKLLPVRTGGSVVFPNEDQVFHNVFSYSPVRSFDLGRYTPEEEQPVRDFPEAGVVKLFCEVHGHMRATILVLDSPYFAPTREDGGFRLDNLPAGEFTLVVWIDEKTQKRLPVTLTAGEVLRVEWEAE